MNALSQAIKNYDFKKVAEILSHDYNGPPYDLYSSFDNDGNTPIH